MPPWHREGRLAWAASGRPVPLRGSGGYQQEGLDGLGSVPGSSRNRRPRIASSQPVQAIVEYGRRSNNGPRDSKSRYARFSTI
jgi:hypothetical protein